MKQLFLIRHGKSSWDLNVRDHDRVLLQKGVEDAHLIGERLKQLSYFPTVMWSSTAARALQTAVIVSEYLDYNLTKLKLKRALYTFDHQELIHTIKSCDDSCDSLMIFSHNHGLTNAVNALGSVYFDNVPTTGVVLIEFNVDSWQDIKKGTTIQHIFPKNIK